MAIKNWIILSVPIFLSLLFIISLFTGDLSTDAWSLMIGVFSSLFIYFAIQKNQKSYTRKIRETFVASMIRSIDSAIVYEPQSFMDSSVFVNTWLCRMGPNIYDGENYIKIPYPKHFVECSFITAIKSNSAAPNSDRSDLNPLLNGLLYQFVLPVQFRGTTVILHDNTQGTFGWINAELEEKTYQHFTKINMANKDFENKFQVYSTREAEAREFVDKDLQEILLKLQAEFNAPLQMSMLNKYVYVTIDNEKRYFHPGFVLINQPKLIRKSESEVKEILKVPEALHLTVEKFIHRYNIE
jgi:hypothetical protein